MRRLDEPRASRFNIQVPYGVQGFLVVIITLGWVAWAVYSVVRTL